MATCEKCKAIVPNLRDAPGHDSLISLGDVHALEEARRGVRREAYTCADCGAEWDYRHDKRDPASGWRRGETAAQAPERAANAA